MSQHRDIGLLADLIEPSLSGQYGRDVAEDIARECLEVLAMKDPKKWEIGRSNGDEPIFWTTAWLFAENEQDAERKAGIMEEHWIARGLSVHVKVK